MCLHVPPAALPLLLAALRGHLQSLTLATPALGTELASALVNYYAASLYLLTLGFQVT